MSIAWFRFLPHATALFVFTTKMGQFYENSGGASLLQRSVILFHKKPEWEAPVPHQVDPYSLLLHQCGLYVLAYSHLASGLRLFAVEGITEQKVDSLSAQSFICPS